MADHNDIGMNNKAQKSNIFIGIDGGGTKCKAVLLDQENNVLGSGVSGSGNPVNGLEQAQMSIVESAQGALTYAKMSHEWLQSIELSDINAGIGLAGVNIPKMHDLMVNWKSPFKSKYITTDLVIACLGAHNGGDGSVIVSGTGSSGFSYSKGIGKSIGGHGFPQGDKGSGAWFGLKAVEAVLLSLDNLAPSTSIAHYLFQELQVDDATGIIGRVASQPSSFFARLAFAVFKAAEDSDKAAQSIVHEGATYLSNMAKLLNQPTSSLISLIGGMTESIIPFLDIELQKRITRPICPPEVGAVFYARQQMAATKKAS